jgi:hypothetical protein
MSVVPPFRDAINRAHPQYSTGPEISEGKKRALLNAMRHGLTSQIVVLPSEDLRAYGDFCAQYHCDLKPSGIRERQSVQTIADIQWRINRIRAVENNLLSLGFEEQSKEIYAADPEIHRALAQAKAMQLALGDLARLSLYEQRLTRTLHQAVRALEKLQGRRKEHGELPPRTLDAASRS